MDIVHTLESKLHNATLSHRRRYAALFSIGFTLVYKYFIDVTLNE